MCTLPERGAPFSSPIRTGSLGVRTSIEAVAVAVADHAHVNAHDGLGETRPAVLAGTV